MNPSVDPVDMEIEVSTEKRHQLERFFLIRRNNTTIKQQLSDLMNRPRSSLSTKFLQFWKDLKVHQPELYSLAVSVLAVPSSQISVERAFSALALILTHLRTNLNKATLANILIEKFNCQLINEIANSVFENLF